MIIVTHSKPALITLSLFRRNKNLSSLQTLFTMHNLPKSSELLAIKKILRFLWLFQRDSCHDMPL